MRRLTFLVIILAALYSGYWFVGARAVETGARDGLANLQAAGWEARYTDLNTIGFPSRFDTTITDLSLIAPDSQFSYSGDFLQIFALSYQPNNAIAVFPEFFRLSLDGRPINVKNEGLRLSAGIKARTDMALDAITAQAASAEISAEAMGLLRLENPLTAIRANPDGDDSYDLYFKADRIEMNYAPTSLTNPVRNRRDEFTNVVIDATATLDKTLNRFAFDGSGAEPVVEKLILNNLTVNQGDIALQAAGTLDIDALGVPDGRITFKTAQWREMIDLLTASGLIDEGIAPTITNVARTMALGRDTLELPVTFQNGFMSVGPLPVGPAPRLR